MGKINTRASVIERSYEPIYTSSVLLFTFLITYTKQRVWLKSWKDIIVLHKCNGNYQKNTETHGEGDKCYL